MDIEKQRERIKKNLEKSKLVDRSKCEEIWIRKEDSQAMCALINGDLGWLMYLPRDGGAGFSSRNLDYQGPDDAVIEYFLDNGQLDEYPASWALPVGDVRRAIREFDAEGMPPTWVSWHNDSGDGTEISG